MPTKKTGKCPTGYTLEAHADKSCNCVSRDPVIEAMKAEITSTFAEFGATVSFESDAALDAYRKGEPLTLRELRALPAGAVVWVWYKEHGESGPRINQAMRATKSAEDAGWVLEDGSSFVAEFEPVNPIGAHDAPPEEDAPCFDDACGEGEMFLYHAVPRVDRPSRTRVARKRSR